MKPRMSATPANVSSGSMNESTAATSEEHARSATSTHLAQPVANIAITNCWRAANRNMNPMQHADGLDRRLVELEHDDGHGKPEDPEHEPQPPQPPDRPAEEPDGIVVGQHRGHRTM